MGRTALYRDPIPYCPARANARVDHDALLFSFPDGGLRRFALDGASTTIVDGFVPRRGVGVLKPQGRSERRFVRMLILEREHDRLVVITPPDRGAVAPGVVHLAEAPADAAIVDDETWDAIADWVLGGGRLGACSIPELARLAAVATSPFAALIGEVAADRALELGWTTRGPLRGTADLDIALQPLSDAARHSGSAAEALVSALAHVAGARRLRFG
ncbi:MAG: hypothetical protein AB7O24_23855 [Kofleriaceae bacterium]